MCDKFERAFVDEVDRIFERNRTNACENVGAPDWKRTILSAPFIELHYAMFDDALIAELKNLICKALTAQMRFHESKPAWAPDLPLSFNAARELKRKRDPRVQLVGFFGLSQLIAQYDEDHPAFEPFCCGLLADDRTSARLRENSKLRRMFPPKHVRELGQGGYWYSPVTLQAWCDLMTKVGASVVRCDNPKHQAEVAYQLFREAITPELERIFA